MNTNDHEGARFVAEREKLTISQIAYQMKDTMKEIHKLHNLIKGARLMRDAVIKEMPASKLHLFDIFTLAVAPIEKEFDEVCKKHTALYDLSIGKGGK